MIEHAQLIQDYKENDQTKIKTLKKALVLLVLAFLIVYATTSVQEITIELKTFSALNVMFLLFLHFKDFSHRWDLEKRKVNIILVGINLERKNPFSNLSFFQDSLKRFNVITTMFVICIFDIAFLNIFYISATQLLHKINPELLAKLSSYSLIKSCIVGACLGFAHYGPIRPLVHFKTGRPVRDY